MMEEEKKGEAATKKAEAAAKKKKKNLGLRDLLLAFDIRDLLDDKQATSLNKCAEVLLGHTTDAWELSDVLNRLKEYFEIDEFYLKVTGGIVLSDDAKKVLTDWEEVREAVEAVQGGKREMTSFRISALNFILQLLPGPWLQQLRVETGSQPLQYAFIEFDPTRFLDDLRQERVHVVLGIVDEKHKKSPGIAMRELVDENGNRIESPYAVVAHPSQDIASAQTVDLSSLANYDQCVIRKETEGPDLPEIPEPIEKNRYEVDFFETVVVFARLNFALGVVPRTPRLDDLQRRGAVVYRPLTEDKKLRVAAYYRKNASKKLLALIDKLITAVTAHLSTMLPKDEDYRETKGLPTSEDDFKGFGCVYYISRIQSMGHPHWFRGELKEWKVDKPKEIEQSPTQHESSPSSASPDTEQTKAKKPERPKALLRFSGQFEDLPEDTKTPFCYHFAGELFDTCLLSLLGWEEKEGKSRPCFVAVLNAMVELEAKDPGGEPNRVLLGSWTAEDDSKPRLPTTAPFLLSQKPLQVPDLHALVRKTRHQALLDAETGFAWSKEKEAPDTSDKEAAHTPPAGGADT